MCIRDSWRSPGTGASEYKFSPSFTDVASASAEAYTQTFAYTGLTSLDASQVGSVDLGGAIAPGATAAETWAVLRNSGNEAFTLHVTASDLTGASKGQVISRSNLKWAASASVAYGSKTAMTASAASTAIVAAVETSDTPTDHPLYLQLSAPSGAAQWMPADTYSGTVTFSTS